MAEPSNKSIPQPVGLVVSRAPGSSLRSDAVRFSAEFERELTRAEVDAWLEARGWLGRHPAGYGPWEITITGRIVRGISGHYSD